MAVYEFLKFRDQAPQNIRASISPVMISRKGPSLFSSSQLQPLAPLGKLELVM